MYKKIKLFFRRLSCKHDWEITSVQGCPLTRKCLLCELHSTMFYNDEDGYWWHNWYSF
jgi:hypothetical protein